MKSSWHLFILLIAASLLAGTIRGEDEPVRIHYDTIRIKLPSVMRSIDDTTRVSEFPIADQPEEVDRARRLMQFREYRRAAEVLEEYINSGAKTPLAYDLLIQCYEQSKEYDRLTAFLKKRIEMQPPTFRLYLDLGKALLWAEQPDSATACFFEAVRFADDKERAYAAVADLYYKAGLYDLERRFLDSARAVTGDSTLAADKMGDALAARQRFAEATEEYLIYMGKDSVAARTGEERIISLMRFPESVDTVMAMLADRISSQTGTEQLRKIYAQMLMEQERFDDAFAFFKRQDSLFERNGVDILIFMQECNKRRKYEQSLGAGDYFLQWHARSSLKNAVQFAMAEAYIGTAQYHDALAAYEDIAGDFIRPAHRAEANLSIGLLYKDHLDDPDKAGEFLNTVIATVPGGPYAVAAQQALGEIAIRGRNLDSAITLYASLLDLDLPPETAERVEFALAETYLFKEEYREAAGRFRQIISRYPRGFYVNDAIQYSLIITETLDEAPKQIDLFSSAEYFRYTKRPDSLEYYLSKICRVGIPSLAPLSYVHLAQLYTDQDRFDEAIAAVDSLERLYPGSYFLPYGLKLKADIFMETPGSREEAMTLYRELLSKYPTYPFAAEIRELIRREVPTGSS